MKLFYHYEQPDPQKIIEGVKKAYGVKNPEKVHGFAGAFLVHHKDVYVTDRVAKKAEIQKTFKDFLENCISRFWKEDYGFVTESEEWNNGETRWLSGSSDWMIARYGCNSLTGGVVYASLYDIVLISFIEEDVSEIYEEQFNKSPYHEHGTLQGFFLNELKYVRHS